MGKVNQMWHDELDAIMYEISTNPSFDRDQGAEMLLKHGVDSFQIDDYLDAAFDGIF